MIYQYVVSDKGYLSCPARSVLRQNTSLVDEFVVTMPAQIDGVNTGDWTLRIEMRLPSGYAYMSEVLPLIDGAITYDVEQGATAEAGTVSIEIVAWRGDAVWKSSQAVYIVTAAINAEQVIPESLPGWTSEVDAIADGDKIILEDVSAAAGSRTKHLLWASVKTALSALYAPLSHNARHSTGGTDAITPASIGAASVTAVSVVLPAANWAENAQTVAVQGVAADSHLIVTAAPASMIAWSNALVYASAQADGTVTFACRTAPVQDLTANILIVEG